MNRTTETLEDEIKFARARGADSLRMMRMSVAHALHAVEDSIERFDGTDDLKTQAECINLAMMRICNDLLPKLRHSLGNHLRTEEHLLYRGSVLAPTRKSVRTQSRTFPHMRHAPPQTPPNPLYLSQSPSCSHHESKGIDTHLRIKSAVSLESISVFDGV